MSYKYHFITKITQCNLGYNCAIYETYILLSGFNIGILKNYNRYHLVINIIWKIILITKDKYSVP